MIIKEIIDELKGGKLNQALLTIKKNNIDIKELRVESSYK